MDCEFLSNSQSSNGGGGNSTPLKKYSERFDELFPYYLSMGMTEEQYWDKDPILVKAYRKAYELNIENRNREMWLQGRYFYDALCAVSPILHAFAKRGTKPSPYPKEPYTVTKKATEERQVSEAKFNYDKNKAWMDAFIKRNNERFQKRGGEINGNRD